MVLTHSIYQKVLGVMGPGYIPTGLGGLIPDMGTFLQGWPVKLTRQSMQLLVHPTQEAPQ